MRLQGRDLSIGTQGPDVASLQRELGQLGFTIARGETRGMVFASTTLSAVQAMQSEHGLETTGVVEEQTASAINAAVDAIAPSGCVVRGHVRLAEETRARGIRVLVFDRDLRTEQSLGEQGLDDEGRYEITYDTSQFRRSEKNNADLVARALAPDGTLLAESDTLFNAPRVAVIDLDVTPRGESQLSDYERLSAELRPILDDAGLAELTEEEERFVAQQTGIELARIESIVGWTRLSLAAQVPAEVFCALDHAGLPVDLERLLEDQAPEVIVRAIEDAIEGNVVPSSLLDSLEEVEGRFAKLRMRFASARERNAPSHELRGRLLNGDDGTPLSGYLVRAPDLKAEDTTDAEGIFVFVYTTPAEVRTLTLVVLDPEEQEVARTEVLARPGSSEIVEIRAPARGSSEGPVHQATEVPAHLLALSPDVDVDVALVREGFASLTSIAREPRSKFVRRMRASVGDFKASQLHIMALAQQQFLDNVTFELKSNKANGFAPTEADMSASESALLQQPCGCRDCEAAVSPAAYLADLLAYSIDHLEDAGEAIDLGFLTGTFHQHFGELSVSCEDVERQVLQVRICIEVLRSYLASLPPMSAVKQQTLNKATQDYLVAVYTSLLTHIGTSYEELRLARGADLASRAALAERLGFDLDPRNTDGVAALSLDPEADAGDPQALTERALEALFGVADTSRQPLSEGAKLGDSAGQIGRWNLDGVEWARNTDRDGKVYLSLSRPSAGYYRVDAYRDPLRTELVARGGRSTGHGLITLTQTNGSRLTGEVEISYSSDASDIQIVAVPSVLSWRLARLRRAWTEQDRPPDAYGEREVFQPLAELPAGVQFPSPLDAKTSYLAEAGVLAFKGGVSEAERDELLTFSPDPAYQKAVLKLYLDARVPPVIDPDLIGPDDFRVPFGEGDPAEPEGATDTPFDLWRKRRALVDRLLINLGDDRASLGLEQVLGNVLGLLPSDLEPLAVALGEGSDAERDEANDRLRSLSLDADSLARLIAVREKALLADSGEPGVAVTREEWRDLDSILARVEKAKRFSSWRQSEQEVVAVLGHALLGPRVFWPSLRAPAEGSWPPAPKEGIPWIDPQALAATDLPGPMAARRAHALWEARKRSLEKISDDLQSAREDGGPAGFDDMLKLALGHPAPGDPLEFELDQLQQHLGSADEGEVEAAKSAIIDGLHLTIDDFVRVLAARAKQEEPDPLKKPAESEWADVYAMLTRARKAKHEFPKWLAEEQNETTGVVYWTALASRLPRWRASAEQRASWQAALEARSRPAVIDPDLIGLDHLQDVGPGYAPYELWKERRTWIDGQIAALEAQQNAAIALAGFDLALVQNLFDDVALARVRTQIQAAREAKGLEYVLTDVWGEPLPDLNLLLGQLTGASGSTQVQARVTISQRLALVPAAFEQVMAVWAKVIAGSPVTDGEWDEIEAILAQALLLRSCLSLDEQRAEGGGITAALEQLSLPRDAFSHLLRIRSMLARSQPVLESEWDDMRSILVQVQKRRRSADWHEDERLRDVALGPDLFAIPSVDPTIFPPPASPELPAWRASSSERRDWQRTLQARLDQTHEAAEALAAAVADVEEGTLRALRDALIGVSNAQGSALDAKAKWVTDHLLIDAQNGSCQRTTRVAQAIETMQVLLFSARTRQLEDSFPTFALEADHFDAEWEWLGSYPTWRAAMFVFLYPENILIPSLRKWQTPAFAQLILAVRANARLTPEDACQAAKTYADYFKDVCKLKVTATASATTRIHAGSCRNQVATRYASLFYLFGLGPETKSVYWSHSDPDDHSGYGQSFWEPLTGLEGAVELIGSAVYERTDDDRWLYLIAKTRQKGASALTFVRYDLERQLWSDGVDLKLPDEVDDFSAVIRRQYGPNTSPVATFLADEATDKPPRVVVRANGGAFYYEYGLNETGESWLEEDAEQVGSIWTSWARIGPKTTFPPGTQVTALARTSSHVDLFVVGHDGGIYSNWWDAESDDGQWHDWFRIGTAQNAVQQRTAVAALARYPNHLDIFVVGNDGEVYGSWWDLNANGGTWAPWAKLPGDTRLGLTPTVVTAIDRNPDRINLFLADDHGEVRKNRWDGSWHPWATLGHPHLVLPQSVITPLRPISNRIELFAVGQDGNAWSTWWEAGTGTGWSEWSTVAADGGFPQPSVVTALARYPDHRDVFTIGGDGSVYSTWRNPNANDGKWNQWFRLPVPPSSFPVGSMVSAVATRKGDHIDLFGAAEDGGVYSSHWDKADWTWGEWSRIPGLNVQPSSPVSVVSRKLDFLELFVVGGDGGVYQNATFDWSGSAAIEPPSFQATPKVTGPFDITEQIPEAKLQLRRQQIEIAYKANETGPASNLTYVDEAYYFVPVYLALQLQAVGEYTAALDWLRTVYDYSAPLPARKIYYGLRREESRSATYKRAEGWLLDPLNPHEIASTRRNTYTRFTVLAIVICLLDFADAEFTLDTPESIPRARTLYLTALELLASSAPKQSLGACQDVIGSLEIEVDDPVWAPIYQDLLGELGSVTDFGALDGLVATLKKTLANGGPWEDRLVAARDLVAEAKQGKPALRISEVLDTRATATPEMREALLEDSVVFDASQRVAEQAGAAHLEAVSAVSGLSSKELLGERIELAWLAEKNKPVFANSGGPPVTHKGLLQQVAKSDTWSAVQVISRTPVSYTPAVSFSFCVPPNPVLQFLRLRAELNLFKLRNCRNIAGMQRELEAYAAPTDTVSGLPSIGPGGQLSLPGQTGLRPTPYRYALLIERAKQLVQLAAQIESSMLAAIEKLNAEQYSVLKARQDARLAHANVLLHDLRVREAENGLRLAELQKERAQISADYFTGLLAEGVSDLEQESLTLQAMAVGAFYTASVMSAIPNVIAGLADGVIVDWGGIMGHLAQSFSAHASFLATIASYQRRAQQWQYELNLAQQDIGIGAQQVQMADDHVRVANQEQQMAQIGGEHAAATLDFLSNKFTNVELYDWMSRTLEAIYSYFLQQATTMAQLAANQLAFERQVLTPPFIQDNYWQPLSETSGQNGSAPDRRGLTGSARLLQDIYQLDQYAFEKNTRKLQLTKTISLARLSPAEFQRFRERGVMTFKTPMELFDREFPGHYLRLIRKVRTSVIALVPPTAGIRATLSAAAVSRVVVGNGVFQTMIVNHGPQSVALSSPRDATGVFELDPQAELLMPFEGMGVDTTWELRMPKAANSFDYRTIADILITIEYTALESFDYRQQVIQGLGAAISADRPFSFRHGLADQWYDLHNPDQTAIPMTVRFSTTRNDFPPNFSNLKIAQVVLYFSRADEKAFEVPVNHLHFTEQESAGAVGGGAITLDGVISTLKGNAGSWTPMIGKAPIGEWELALPNTSEMKDRFRNEEIDEMLFVITYTGLLPEWPL